MTETAKSRATAALADALGATGTGLDSDQRVSTPRENVVSTVSDEALTIALEHLAQGGGGELTSDGEHEPKFHSAFSSSALAVNAFGPWLEHRDRMLAAGRELSARVEFEAKCPTGLKGQPPNLDVLLTSNDRVVAIESKCTEHFEPKEPKFAEAYEDRVREVAHPSWQEAFELRPEKRHLDTAQLVKHYLGLKTRFPDGPTVTLLYLFWEPVNSQGVPDLCEHRRELSAFRATVNDPAVRFDGTSYAELWAMWSTQRGIAWLPEHLAQLRARYDVEI